MKEFRYITNKVNKDALFQLKHEKDGNWGGDDVFIYGFEDLSDQIAGLSKKLGIQITSYFKNDFFNGGEFKKVWNKGELVISEYNDCYGAYENFITGEKVEPDFGEEYDEDYERSWGPKKDEDDEDEIVDPELFEECPQEEIQIDNYKHEAISTSEEFERFFDKTVEFVNKWTTTETSGKREGTRVSFDFGEIQIPIKNANYETIVDRIVDAAYDLIVRRCNVIKGNKSLDSNSNTLIYKDEEIEFKVCRQEFKTFYYELSISVSAVDKKSSLWGMGFKNITWLFKK